MENKVTLKKDNDDFNDNINPITFPLCDTEITFTKDEQIFCNIYANVICKLYIECEKFENNFNITVTDRSTLIKGFNIFTEYVSKMCYIVENAFAKDDVYDYDTHDITFHAVSGVDGYFQDFMNDIAHLENISAQLSEYRNQASNLNLTSYSINSDTSNFKGIVGSALSSLMVNVGNNAINSINSSVNEIRDKQKIELAIKNIYSKYDFKDIFCKCIKRSKTSLMAYYCAIIVERIPKYKNIEKEVNRFTNSGQQIVMVKNIMAQVNRGNTSRQKAIEILVDIIKNNVYILNAYMELQNLVPNESEHILNIISFMGLEYAYSDFINTKVAPSIQNYKVFRKSKKVEFQTLRKKDIIKNIEELQQLKEAYSKFDSVVLSIQPILEENLEVKKYMDNYSKNTLEQLMTINGKRYNSFTEVKYIYDAMEWINEQKLDLSCYDKDNLRHVNEVIKEFISRFSLDKETLNSIPVIKKLYEFCSNFNNNAAKSIVQKSMGEINFSDYSFDNAKIICKAKKILEDWFKDVNNDKSYIGCDIKPEYLKKCEDYLDYFYYKEYSNEIETCNRYCDQYIYDKNVELFISKLIEIPESEKRFTNKKDVPCKYTKFKWYLDYCYKIKKGTYGEKRTPIIIKLFIESLIIIGCCAFISSLFAKILLVISVIALFITWSENKDAKKAEKRVKDYLNNAYYGQTKFLVERLN